MNINIWVQIISETHLVFSFFVFVKDGHLACSTHPLFPISYMFLTTERQHCIGFNVEAKKGDVIEENRD